MAALLNVKVWNRYLILVGEVNRRLLRRKVSQCSGTSPSQFTPEGLRRTLGSSPQVTAWLMTACFSSSSKADELPLGV